MSNKKSIDEMIAVMQAFKDGKNIQSRARPDGTWLICREPSWGWNGYDYRVKPEPRIFNFYFNEQSGSIVSVSEYNNFEAYYSKLGYKLVTATGNINE